MLNDSTKNQLPASEAEPLFQTQQFDKPSTTVRHHATISAIDSPNAFTSRSKSLYNRYHKFEAKDQQVAKMALMKDNPNSSSIKNISKYVKKLDERLSVPKTMKIENPEEQTSNMLKKMSVGSFGKRDGSQTCNERYQNFDFPAEIMKSQDEREKKRKQIYRAGLLHKKISIDDKKTLFGSIKKGQNERGGTFGDRSLSPDREGDQKY